MSKVGTLFFSLLLFSAILLSGCGKKTPGSQDPLLSSGDNGELSAAGETVVYTDEQIKELGKDLKEVETAVNKVISKVSHKRQLYRRLGDRYLELGWFRESYDNYRQSLGIKNDDETVHYKAAVVAASYHKQIAPMSDAVVNLERAEYHYLKAIEIRPDYREALAGLATLYHFEMNRPLDALELVNRGIGSESRSSLQLLMLRGNIYRFLAKVRQEQGRDLEGADRLLSAINRQRSAAGLKSAGWQSLAAEDYQTVVNRFGGAQQAEVKEVVSSAVRLLNSLTSANAAD